MQRNYQRHVEKQPLLSALVLHQCSCVRCCDFCYTSVFRHCPVLWAVIVCFIFSRCMMLSRHVDDILFVCLISSIQIRRCTISYPSICILFVCLISSIQIRRCIISYPSICILFVCLISSIQIRRCTISYPSICMCLMWTRPGAYCLQQIAVRRW